MNAAGPTRHEPIGAPGEGRQLKEDRFQFGWRERTETLAEAQADAVERRKQLMERRASFSSDVPDTSAVQMHF